MMQRPSRPFDAQYASDCSGCGVEIEEGDTIVMWKGEPYHDDEECCEGLKEPAPSQSIGPVDRWK